MIIDAKAAYLDLSEDSGDLETAVAELEARRALEREVRSMNLALSQHDEDMRLLVDVRFRRRVATGTPELQLAVAARLKAMQIRRGESARDYAERLRELARDGTQLRTASASFARLIDRMRVELARSFADTSVAVAASPATLRLIRPGPRQVDHFRGLSWGESVRRPRYRPVPNQARRGAYDEPFSHYYFDPYFDFVAWVTLEEIVAGRGWPGLAFEVVDETGERLFDEHSAAGQAALGGGFGPEVVRFVGTGLEIDDAVPVFETSQIAAAHHPNAVAGFGGDGRSNEGATGADWQEGLNQVGNVDGGDLGGCGVSCGGEGCGA